MNVRNFCYSNFGWLGKGLFTIVPGFEKDLDSAYMKIHPEVYLSILGFVSLVSVFASILVGILIFIGLIRSLPFPPSGGILFSPVILVIPLLILVLGVRYPKTAASNRVSGLKIEIPYASMYISTMTRAL